MRPVAALALAALLIAALVLVFGQGHWSSWRRPSTTPAAIAARQPGSPTRLPSQAPVVPTLTSDIVVASVSGTPTPAMLPGSVLSIAPPDTAYSPTGRSALRSLTTVTPTSVPPTPTLTRSPTLVATATSPSPVAVTAPPLGSPTVVALLPLVVQSEAGLVSGEFEAALELGSGSSATTRVRFHLGEGAQPPRLHLLTTYTNGPTTETIERITISDRSWQRQPNGVWAPIAEQEGVWGQVQAVLPQARTVTDVTQDTSEKTGVLRWYDSNRSADVTLQVDPITGIPREMQQVTRGLFSRRIIIYRRWNTPVEIPVPGPP